MFVTIFPLAFGVAQFSDMVSKPFYCTNLRFGAEVDEVLSLIKTTKCLAAPGMKIPGRSLSSIFTHENIGTFTVEWSRIDLKTFPDFSDLKISREIRFLLALLVFLLAAFRVRKEFLVKAKNIKPWYEEP